VILRRQRQAAAWRRGYNPDSCPDPGSCFSVSRLNDAGQDLGQAAEGCRIRTENAISLLRGYPDAVNTLSSPDRVVPTTLDDPKLDGDRLQAVLPPLSSNMIRLS
jgi:hypothetical protein